MIAKKLLEIQKGLRALGKDAKAYNYNYVSGDKLLYYVRPKMDELGLLLLPEVLGVDTKEVLYPQWDSKARTVVEKKEVLYILSMRMTWTDTEDGETLSQEWKAAGMNAFDKGYGSALTYGERYYMLKVFHIATDADDVDAVSAERDKAMEEASAAPAPSPAPGTQAATPGFKPMDINDYWKVVKAEAEGRVSKSGRTYRDEYWKKTHAGRTEMEKFDDDVEQYKIDNGFYDKQGN